MLSPVSVCHMQAMIRGLELLYALGALDDRCKLTPDLGEKMAGTHIHSSS